jgi:lysophospholipase L1-like esterase
MAPALLRLLTCAALALCVLSGCDLVPGEPRATARAKPTDRPPIVVMFGDSYTAGLREVPAERTYAAETARTMGWQVIIAGRAGSGFVTRGAGGQDFNELWAAQLSWRPAPDMIVISGGHNDVLQPVPAVAAAAERLLATVRLQWPRTRIVVLGPLWGGDPPPRALLVRDAVRNVAAATKTPFIDPLAGRWITGHAHRGGGNARQMVLRDGIHLSPAGNRHVADRLIHELRVLGLATPAR